VHTEQDGLTGQCHASHELGLDELEACYWLFELDSLFCVLESRFTGPRCHACRHPGHKDPGVHENFFGTGGEVSGLYQTVLFGHKHFVKSNISVLNSSERQFSLNLFRL